MDGFYINAPGALTSVQDCGRFGYQWSGMCPSGAMDMHALRIANILVGNDMDEAGLEVTLLGPDVSFLADEVIAITGADLSPVLDGLSVPLYQAVPVKRGQRLQFGLRRSGCRAYVAFAGGLDIEPLYGSRSTLLRSGIGGFHGRALRKEDTVGFRSPSAVLPNMEARRVPPAKPEGDDVLLRVIPGPQDDMFTEKGMANFFGSEGYRVTNLCDRQGYRLEGEKVKLKQVGSIVSDGISKGAVQVPPNEQPIILLSERQSTGGYAKIGNVITVDIPKIGQAMAGSRIRFQRISIEEAQRLIAEEDRYLHDLEARIRMAQPQKYRVSVNHSTYYVILEEIS